MYNFSPKLTMLIRFMILKVTFVEKEKPKLIHFYTFKILEHHLKLFVSKNVPNLTTTQSSIIFLMISKRMEQVLIQNIQDLYITNNFRNNTEENHIVIRFLLMKKRHSPSIKIGLTDILQKNNGTNIFKA